MCTLSSLKSKKLLALSCVWLLVLTCVSAAQPQVSVNDRVRLRAYSDLGVPLHPGSGNRGVSDRLIDGAIAIVREIDPQNGWIRITSGDREGWIVRRYIAEVLTGTPADQTYVVGSWNLEHFHEGTTRGFPENTRGGPSYPGRTQNDYEAIAAIIETLEVRILVLEEVYAREVEVDGETDIRSQEVERLIGILGPSNYDYVVGESGRSQHIAILYDERFVRLNAACECDLPNERVGNKSLFDRQPLIAHFTFLDGGEARNDLAIVGLHLASGQSRTTNHDRAMELLVDELRQARTDEDCIPPDENDILITGDLNANRFDNRREQFWDRMENNGWDVLGDNDANYPATRLSGHPLGFHDSKLDYIIVTRNGQGLGGEEVRARQATIHTDLVGTDPVSFRRNASDHIPVTVQVRVMDDTDRL